LPGVFNVIYSGIVESQAKIWKPSVNAAVRNIEERLKKGDLPVLKLSKGLTPMSDKYRPEVDVSEELNAELTTYYQELIGILRWAVEIGRADVILEVSKKTKPL
jgi:hypothetical protein